MKKIRNKSCHPPAPEKTAKKSNKKERGSATRLVHPKWVFCGKNVDITYPLPAAYKMTKE